MTQTFGNALIIALLLVVVLLGGLIVRAQDAPKVTGDSWFCTTTSFNTPGCFQFGKVAYLIPANGFVSLISGEEFNIDQNDFSRLQRESQGLIPSYLGN
jgi:hypothetical protein